MHTARPCCDPAKRHVVPSHCETFLLPVVLTWGWSPHSRLLWCTNNFLLSSDLIKRIQPSSREHTGRFAEIKRGSADSEVGNVIGILCKGCGQVLKVSSHWVWAGIEVVHWPGLAPTWKSDYRLVILLCSPRLIVVLEPTNQQQENVYSTNNNKVKRVEIYLK